MPTLQERLQALAPNIDTIRISIETIRTYIETNGTNIEMIRLQERLQALAPNIETILSASSTAGASVGVIHRGRLVFRGNYGFRDHALSKTPDSDTLYNIGSLTKSMVAAAAGVQVSKGNLQWTSRVSDIIPAFKRTDKTISDSCNIIDLLAHKTGLPAANVMWCQGESKPLFEMDDLCSVIGKVSRQPWHQVLRQNIWEPLGMVRTTTSGQWHWQEDNVAEGFSGLESGQLHPVKSQIVWDSTIMGAAEGVCSSVNELLLYYTALMKASHQTSTGTNSDTASAPFSEVQTLLSPHAVLSQPSFGLSETTYALGLVRGQLPGKVGVLSENTGLVAEMPIIGKGTTPQRVLYHSGALSGFYSSAYLMPETDSCVVVLVNTKPVCDSADWIAQYLLETLLGTKEVHDFVALTNESVKTQSLRYKKASEELEKGRVEGTEPKPFESYLG
ncbi:MAG: hypothetical protein Q9226_004076 [Calogaya cf. arnoldii]